MLKAIFHPPTMKTFKLWAGLYGGHYDIIVFFEKPPTHITDKYKYYNGSKDKNGPYVDCLAEFEIGNIFADFYLEDFRTCFPDVDLTPYTQKNGRPRAIEVPAKDLFQISLTIPVDQHNNITILIPHVDWC